MYGALPADLPLDAPVVLAHVPDGCDLVSAVHSPVVIIRGEMVTRILHNLTAFASLSSSEDALSCVVS